MPGGYRPALCAYAIWGLSPLYWNLLDDVPVAQVTAHRFVQVLAVGAVVLWLRDRTTLRALVADRRTFALHAVAGALLATNWIVFVWGVTSDHVVDVSLGYFINPLFSVVLGLVVLGERLTPARWVAVALAAIGVAVLTVDTGALPWISLVLAATFAVYGLMKKRSDRESFAGLTTEMIALAPIALAFLVVTALRGDLSTGAGTGLAALPLIGIFTATPLVLFGMAARRIPLWAIGLLQFVAPTFQFVLGVAIYDEPLGALRLAGFAVIWTGLAVFAVDTYRRRTPPAVAPSKLGAESTPEVGFARNFER